MDGARDRERKWLFCCHLAHQTQNGGRMSHSLCRPSKWTALAQCCVSEWWDSILDKHKWSVLKHRWTENNHLMFLGPTFLFVSSSCHIPKNSGSMCTWLPPRPPRACLAFCLWFSISQSTGLSRCPVGHTVQKSAYCCWSRTSQNTVFDLSLGPVSEEERYSQGGSV